MKINTIKMLLGPLEGFIGKITAFIEDSHHSSIVKSIDNTNSIDNNNTIDNFTDNNHNNIKLLSLEIRNKLKNQLFMKSERIKELLTEVSQRIVQITPDFRDMLKVSDHFDQFIIFVYFYSVFQSLICLFIHLFVSLIVIY